MFRTKSVFLLMINPTTLFLSHPLALWQPIILCIYSMCYSAPMHSRRQPDYMYSSLMSIAAKLFPRTCSCSGYISKIVTRAAQKLWSSLNKLFHTKTRQIIEDNHDFKAKYWVNPQAKCYLTCINSYFFWTNKSLEVVTVISTYLNWQPAPRWCSFSTDADIHV